MNLPIACTLSTAELAQRKAGLLPGLAARAAARDALENGFRWRFAGEPDLLLRMAEAIEAERQCCRFLRFTLTVEPDGGAIWLEVTGPAGTREFLDAVIA